MGSTEHPNDAHPGPVDDPTEAPTDPVHDGSTEPTRGPGAIALASPPQSVFRRRWRKFRSLKRGWYSFLILSGALFLSLFNPLLVNNQALIVHYQGQTWFPAIGRFHDATEFGQRTIGEADYRALQRAWAEKPTEGNSTHGDPPDRWILMPPYPYHPNESLLKDPTLPGPPPHPPSRSHWMGTDDRGRDVFARLVYGYRLSMVFGLSVVVLSYGFGVTVGAILGYFGGRVDMIGQRLVEIWAMLPFLYTIIIVANMVKPGPHLLAVLLAAFAWVAISLYTRGEFYREKAKDYVAAAVAVGESDASIMLRHILPNALTPVISFAPFALVGAIVALVSLDFLGFGVPPPTPSWGELANQARNNITEWHLALFPLGAMFLTLLMVVFIGEAVREAFDPKTFARLR